MRAQVDFGARPVPQFQVACDEVGVKVSQENVPDRNAVLLRIFHVLIDITLRVYDCRLVCLFVADEIRSVRKTCEIVLLQYHYSSNRKIAILSSGFIRATVFEGLTR
jgi:hypothetical protein